MEIFFWQIHPLTLLKHSNIGYIGRKKTDYMYRSRGAILVPL